MSEEMEIIRYIEAEFSRSTHFIVTNHRKYYNSAKEEIPFIQYAIYNNKVKDIELMPEGFDYSYRIASFAVIYYDFDLNLTRCEQPTIEICGIRKDDFFSGTEIVQKIESIGKMISCKSLFLDDKSNIDIDISSNNEIVKVPLALLSISIDARTWYNKLGYYEKNYEEHYVYHSKFIEQPLRNIFSAFDPSYKIFIHYIERGFHLENEYVKSFLDLPMKIFFADVKKQMKSRCIEPILLDMIILLLNDANEIGLLQYSEYDSFVKRC